MIESPASRPAPATRLADLTTMRVGGPAERLIVAESSEDLARHARALWELGEPWLLLGGGSNTVVHDDGYPGAVLLVRNSGAERIAKQDDDSRVRLRVQAGHDWDELVELCVRRGWAGIEPLSGIPGLAGAAPIQNIGAYGAELEDVLHSIEFLDADTDEIVRVPAAELELGYRTSSIKRGRAGVVLSIDLLLEANGDGLSAPIRYAQLAQALERELGERVPVAELRDAVLELRRSKGMVLSDEDHDSWSAGSFFTNPIVSERFAGSLPSDAPRFPLSDEDDAPTIITFEELSRGVTPPVPRTASDRLVKLSAAWLIEQAGVKKGFRLPGSGASISNKHALAITNRGAASAADVAELARFIVQRVQQEFGIVLVPEPNLYGLEL